MSTIPSADLRHPLPGVDRVAFLKSVVTNPRIEVGDYTYYDDPDGPERFEDNVLYHFDFIGDRLIIGKFCQIAAKATFIMNGGNHRTAGFSTYPFMVFGGAWAGRFDAEGDFPHRGDTTIGNDVWIGYGVTVMPGVTIGDGAIVAAGAVVSADVPPYAVVAGNPAKVVRMRFDDASVRALLEIRWWDWEIEKITACIPAICGADIDALRRAAASPKVPRTRGSP